MKRSPLRRTGFKLRETPPGVRWGRAQPLKASQYPTTRKSHGVDVRPPPKPPSPEWVTNRKAARERDGSCQARKYDIATRCDGALHIHHIRPRSVGGGHEMSNLMLLCRLHHEWAHSHQIEAKKAGLLR